MRRVLLVFVCALIAAVLVVAEQEGPAGFQVIVGPRIGVSYYITTPEMFTESISDLYVFPSGNYFPVTTLFGVMAEQRILLGETRSHFAFQEVLLIGGLEQAIGLPSLSVLIGYRDASGLEIGAGPTLSLSGLGVVTAIGWTISTSGVYIPVNLSLVLPSQQRPAGVALTTGFNFVVRRSSPHRF